MYFLLCNKLLQKPFVTGLEKEAGKKTKTLQYDFAGLIFQNVTYTNTYTAFSEFNSYLPS